MKRKKIAVLLLIAAMTAESACSLYAEEVSSISAESFYETDLADSSDAQAVDVDDFSTVDVADEISASDNENTGDVSTVTGDDTAAGKILEEEVTQADASSEDLFDDIVISEDEAYIDLGQDAEEPGEENTGTTNAEGENISADDQGDLAENDTLVDYIDIDPAGIETDNLENAQGSETETGGINLLTEEISAKGTENHLTATAEKRWITVAPGGEAALKVNATADQGTLTYKWYHYYRADGDTYERWHEIEGAEGNALTTDAIYSYTQYRVYVADQYGNRAGVQFHISVENHLMAEAEKSRVSVILGETATLKVNATADNGTFTYKWYHYYKADGDAYERRHEVEGAEENMLTTDAITARTRYDVDVTDQYGNTESVRFNVYVDNNFSAHAVGLTDVYVLEGGSTSLIVEATAKQGSITYKWTRWNNETKKDDELSTEDGVTVNDGSSTLSISNVSQNGEYICFVSDEYGNNDEIWFNLYKTNTLKLIGETSVNVTPADEPPVLSVEVVTPDQKTGISYQWYSGKYNDDSNEYVYTEIPGATDSSYKAPVVEGYYRVVAKQGTEEDELYIIVSVDSGLTVSPNGENEENISLDSDDASAKMEVTASTDFPDKGIMYTWYEHSYDSERWNTIAVANSPSCEVKPGKDTEYYCEVTDGYMTMRTATFYVTYNSNLQYSPASRQTIYSREGETQTLSLTATTGKGNLSYQWYVEDYDRYKTKIEGATGPRYTATTGSAPEEYVCVVSNGYTSGEGHFVVSPETEDASKVAAASNQTEALRLAVGEHYNIHYDGTGVEGQTVYFRVEPKENGDYCFYSSGYVYLYAELTDETGNIVEPFESAEGALNFHKVYHLETGKIYYLETSVWDDVDVSSIFMTMTSAHVHSWDSGKVTQEATCVANGIRTFTCTSSTCHETKTETIPALGHQYGAPTYTWSADNSAVTATRVCSRNASHVETETAHTTSSVSRAATCTVKGTTTYTAAFSNPAFSAQTRTLENINATGHRIVTDAAVAPTTTSEGKTQGSHCSVCGTVITAQVVIPKLSVEGDVNDQTSVAAVAKTVTSLKKQSAEVAGAKFTDFKLQIAKSAKTSLKIKWSKYSGADGYIIFGSKCGKAMKQLATVGAKTTSYTQKGLKKGTAYKYIVSAYKTNADGTRHVLATSLSVHGSTTNGKKTTINKVTASGKKKITLKKGKSTTLKVKLTGLKKGLKILQHRKVTFISSNPSVASVSAKSGKVKAKKAGKCTIYAYSDSGKYVTFTINVKKK